jgi:creatinine amidohydrolase
MTNDDIDEVLSLWRATEGVGLSASDTGSDLSMFLTRNPELALVARDDGRLAGAILCGHDGRRGYLHHLAVSPAHRRRGLGQELVGRCLDSLRALGIQKCHLFVFAKNTGAVAFWRRIGWDIRDDLCMMSRQVGTESSIPGSRDAQPKATAPARNIRMVEMTWPDVSSALEQGFTTVVIAVGSTEQHGPHLPTMTDARIGDELAQRVAMRLGHTLQAGTITIGCSDHHLAFPGTISLKAKTLRMIILDYADSLVRGGFKRIIFLPLHGGNFSTVQETVEEAQAAHPGVRIIGLTDLMKLLGCLNSASAEFGVGADESGAHAGESETSIMMALEADLVIVDRFAPGYVGPTGEREFNTIREQGMRALTGSGVHGDPTKASARKGRVYLDRLVEFLVREIKVQSQQPQ